MMLRADELVDMCKTYYQQGLYLVKKRKYSQNGKVYYLLHFAPVDESKGEQWGPDPIAFQVGYQTCGTCILVKSKCFKCNKYVENIPIKCRCNVATYCSTQCQSADATVHNGDCCAIVRLRPKANTVTHEVSPLFELPEPVRDAVAEEQVAEPEPEAVAEEQVPQPEAEPVPKSEPEPEAVPESEPEPEEEEVVPTADASSSDEEEEKISAKLEEIKFESVTISLESDDVPEEEVVKEDKEKKNSNKVASTASTMAPTTSEKKKGKRNHHKKKATVPPPPNEASPFPQCVICLNPCDCKYGNIPWPVATEGVCCDNCNRTVVLRARFGTK